MSAFIEDVSPFVSHPVENGLLLTDHLLTVANSVRNLLVDTHFNNNNDIVYYSALLHDIGKLNPYYQYLFYNEEKTRDLLKKELLNQYVGQHSIFSAWIASKLLHSTNNLSITHIHIITCLIAAHHSSLRSTINSSINDNNTSFKNSLTKICSFLSRYHKELENVNEYSHLNWSKWFKEFNRPVRFGGTIPKTENKMRGVDNFIEILLYFSILLQSDRGSFSKRNQYKFDLLLITQNLVKSNSKLSELRSRFQHDFMLRFNIEDSITIIQAPTGIGKTKLFLDIVSKYGNANRFNKVIYFSPLLALTEDFENKIKEIIKEKDMSEVLIYNHLFSGSLLEKNSQNEIISPAWDFDNESFNRKFIVTTTQRLLMTLYSNKSSDNLKLFSLKNALLIIDEIQVIPKFLLPNFVEILKSLCKFINTKVLLVSATIPFELVSKDIKVIRLHGQTESIYHDKTLKKIQFSNKIPTMSDELLKVGRKLFMLNTKRKAVITFDKVLKFMTDYNLQQEIKQDSKQPNADQKTNQPNLIYLSTGIRKKTRSKLISQISNQSNCIVVSTQVIEAGVDINFDIIHREVAPLDSIIQVMGRLNREGDSTNPLLNVFLFNDGGKDHRPYNRLEYDESLKLIRTVFNSQDLYNKLEDYYKTINLLNNSNRNLLTDLETKMSNYDYPGVWEFIDKEIFQNEYGEPVIIPENEEELHIIKQELLSDTKSLKSFYKKYGNLTSVLPVPLVFRKETSGNETTSGESKELMDLFDVDLFEKNILLPKSGCLSKIYDDRIGLDKWIKV